MHNTVHAYLCVRSTGLAQGTRDRCSAGVADFTIHIIVYQLSTHQLMNMFVRLMHMRIKGPNFHLMPSAFPLTRKSDSFHWCRWHSYWHSVLQFSRRSWNSAWLSGNASKWSNFKPNLSNWVVFASPMGHPYKMWNQTNGPMPKDQNAWWNSIQRKIEIEIN